MIREPSGWEIFVKQLELRRHARRDPDADRLSAEGRAQAEEVGRAARATTYDAVFTSPAERAAETAAWFLRGAGQQLRDHAVVAGLAGRDATGGSPEGMAAGVRALLDRLDDGATAVAFSHTPFVERAALGLTGAEIDPMGECEGIVVRLHDDGSLTVDELRIG
jgi:phosphohistidine phosphatase SixA